MVYFLKDLFFLFIYRYMKIICPPLLPIIRLWSLGMHKNILAFPNLILIELIELIKKAV